VTAITQTFGSAHSTVSGLLKGQTYVVDEVTATIAMFGNDLQLSEQLAMTSEPNPISTLSKRHFYNAAATMDQKTAMLMTSNSSVTWSTTAPSANYNDATLSVPVVWGDGSATLTDITLDSAIPTHRIAAETFNRAYYVMRRESVPFHSKMPGKRYASIVSPGGAADLRQDGTFQEIALKGMKMGEQKFQDASLGDVFGCVVLESPNTPDYAGSVTSGDRLNHGLVFGDDYFGTVSHASGVGKPKVNLIPATPSPADPYGVIWMLSWKWYWAGTVINPTYGVVLKYVTQNGASVVGVENAAPWI
jgi:N4-gp56 family major capsid protein